MATTGSRRTVMFVHDTNQFGGLEVVLLRVLGAIDRTKFDPVLVVPDTDDPYRASPAQLIDRVEQLGIRILRFPARSGVIGKASEIVGLIRLLRHERPDVVHLHTSRVEGGRKTIIAAAVARVPAVVRTEHNSPTAFSSMPADTRRRKIVDRMTDLVLTVSEHDRIEQIDVVGRSPELVRTLRNGVDEVEFDRDAVDDASVRPLLRSGVPVIGAVGRLTEQKGYEDLVRATARVIRSGIDVQLLLVGDGPLEGRLRSVAAELGVDDRVIFAGLQPDPKPFIAAMDIAVMSSLHEGLPLSLLEFMAMGRPTVVTDHPGMVEAVLDGVTSIVVPRSDPERLAQALTDLLADDERRRRMGVDARRHVTEHFSLRNYIAETEAIYEALRAHSGR